MDKKNLLISKARYHSTLSETTNSVNVASFPGCLAMGVVTNTEDDSQLVFIPQKTVLLYHDCIAQFVVDVILAYRQLKTKNPEPFFHIINTSTYQRVTTSLERYKNNMIFQVRIQFKNESKNTEECAAEEENATVWTYTQKGVVLSLNKLHQLLEQMDSIIMGILSPSDKCEEWLSCFFELALEQPDVRIHTIFLDGLDLNDLSTIPYMVRKRKIKEILNLFCKYSAGSGKKKTMNDGQKRRITTTLISRFKILFSLMYFVQNFIFDRNLSEYESPAIHVE